MKYVILITLLILSLNAKAELVPEIADTKLREVALATYVDDEVVILYNSDYCNILGPLVCKFYLAHEYGHINLGHILKGKYPGPLEFEADCWAARNASIAQVQAVYIHFMKKGFMSNWPYSTREQRAKRLLACAGN